MNNECLLPDVAYGSLPVKIEKHLDNLDESLLFDRNTVVNALKSSNYDTTSIDMPYEPKPGPSMLQCFFVVNYFAVLHFRYGRS